MLVGALVPAMAGRGSGAVVTIGSWMASVGSPSGAVCTAPTPAGVIHPEDVARGVLVLASDDAAMVHGITLYVDGGITATKLS